MNAASISRHLRLVHKLSKEEAANATAKFGIRKEYTWKTPRAEPKRKDRHLLRQCPLDGCLAVVRRMGPHLRSKAHLLLPSDPQYKELCKNAVVYENDSVLKIKKKSTIAQRAAIIEENRWQVDRFFGKNYSDTESSSDESYTPSSRDEEQCEIEDPLKQTNKRECNNFNSNSDQDSITESRTSTETVCCI